MKVTGIDGQEVDLETYRGRTLLIVNVASECGYTKQYAPLQALYEAYEARGLEILGFPSNDFGAQEPGSDAEIAEFCEARFGVTFPMFSKIHVTGPDRAPLYDELVERAGQVKWNFTKFLVDPSGEVVSKFEPSVDPMGEELRAAIEAHLPGEG